MPTEEEAASTPYQRYGHTAVEHEGLAYVWGGRNDSIGACKILYRFNGGECTDMQRFLLSYQFRII